MLCVPRNSNWICNSFFCMGKKSRIYALRMTHSSKNVFTFNWIIIKSQHCHRKTICPTNSFESMYLSIQIIIFWLYKCESQLDIHFVHEASNVNVFGIHKNDAISTPHKEIFINDNNLFTRNISNYSFRRAYLFGVNVFICNYNSNIIS